MKLTLTQLYRLTTGDLTAAHPTIRAHVGRLDARVQTFIRYRIAGESLRTIAERAGISHGSVASAIRHGLVAAAKSISGAPRYHRTGRRRRQAPAAPRSARRAPAPMRPDEPEVQTCHLLRPRRHDSIES